MENGEIEKYAEAFADSLVQGNGEDAVRIMKKFLEMDIVIDIEVSKERIKKVFNFDKKTEEYYQYAIEKLIEMGVDRKDAEKAAKATSNIEAALEYINTIKIIQ